MSSDNSIKCPNCGTQIDIDEIFYHQIEEKFKTQHLQEQKKLQDEVEQKRKEYKVHLDALKVKEEAFKAQQETFDEEINKATKAQLKVERDKSSMMSSNVSWYKSRVNRWRYFNVSLMRSLNKCKN